MDIFRLNVLTHEVMMSEACNERENICHESMVSFNLFVEKQYSRKLKNSAYGPPIGPSTYESHASIIALAPSDVATTNVESGDDEESFGEEMAHSYKIMYEKLVETVNENRRLLKQISQLCREKNELDKQVNVLNNEKEESLNKLRQLCG